MENANWIIYGANGYTGRLISALAIESGLRPILSGRNEAKVAKLAAELNCDWQTADTANADQLNDLLQNANLVLNCAGPFSRTAQPMAAACLKTGTHYLDITGEMEVFEYFKALNDRAADKNIMLMPGVGFDVVPSDCMSVYLKSLLPDATHLDLALRSKGGSISHGTMTTMIENIQFGGAVRENGKIKRVPHAWKTRSFDFMGKAYKGVTIPWGDVSTAWSSTGIPNIRVFNCAPPSVIRSMKMLRYTGWLMGTRPVQKWLKKRVDKRAPGPGMEKRAKAKSWIWGEACNENSYVRALLEMPEGYSLTALTSVLIATKVLNGSFTAGYQTPGMAYGADLILEVNHMPGQSGVIKRLDLE